MNHLQIKRRTLLTRTASGFGAAIGAGLGSGFGAAARADANEDVWSQSCVADKGGVKLAVYRKRPSKPGASSDKQPPVLFLVHGSYCPRSRASI